MAPKVSVLAELLSSPLTKVDKLVLENTKGIQNIFSKHGITFTPRDENVRWAKIDYKDDPDFVTVEYASISGFFVSLSPSSNALSLRQLEQFLKEIENARVIIMGLKDINIDLIRV